MRGEKSVQRNVPGCGSGDDPGEASFHFGDPGRGPQLRPGMVLAIEPMVTMGSWEVKVLDDGWTAVTRDGSLAAHFEHTIAVTDDGPEVLTSRTGRPVPVA